MRETPFNSIDVLYRFFIVYFHVTIWCLERHKHTY